MVKVRYTHEHHGNAGKVSNSTKVSVMDDFLQFVDSNSQPNGRSAGPHGPTRYFIASLVPYKPLRNVLAIMRIVYRDQ